MAHLFFFVPYVRFSMNAHPKLEGCPILSTCSSDESRDVCSTPFHGFSTFDMHQLWKIRRLYWREHLKIGKLAKLESESDTS